MASEVYLVEDFDKSTIEDRLANLEKGKVLSVWAPSEIELLSEISPSTVKRINASTGSNYAVSSDNLAEEAKSLAAFLILSIDNSVFKGIMNPGMVGSKVKNLGYLYECFGETSPISPDGVTDANLINYAFQVKRLALEVMRRSNRHFSQTAPMEQNPLGFMGFFEGLFGNDLERVVQYGSSVKGGGKDIDLLVFLRKIDRNAYDVILGKREQVPSSIPVSIALLPFDGITGYAECDHNSRNIATEGRLSYGDSLDFPLLKEAEYLRKAYLKTGKILVSLRETLGDPSRHEKLARSPDFLADVLKSEIWIRQALLQQELGRAVTKDEAMKSGYVSSENLGLNPSPAQVRNALYDANIRVRERIGQYLSARIS